TGRVSNVMLLTKERRKIHHISYDYCRLMLPIIPCGLAPGWLIHENEFRKFQAIEPRKLG
ncbi:MAG: hypothetical protein M3Q34_04865, partial [bacterium]|nr:hypothetical protein [bacterium]